MAKANGHGDPPQPGRPTRPPSNERELHMSVTTTAPPITPSSPSANKQCPTACELLEAVVPVIHAPAFFGPPVIFLLGPWLLLVLLLIGPAALLITLALVAVGWPRHSRRSPRSLRRPSSWCATCARDTPPGHTDFRSYVGPRASHKFLVITHRSQPGQAGRRHPWPADHHRRPHGRHRTGSARTTQPKDVMSSPSDLTCRDLLSSSAERVRAGLVTVELEEAPSEHRNGT